MTYPAKILAGILDVPIQKTTDRRRRMEDSVRHIARPLDGLNPTNRRRAVFARCMDLARAAVADPAMFDEFVGSTLEGS